METQLTIRLPAELSSKIKKRAKEMKLKKADIVRKALSEYFTKVPDDDYPYERVKHLIGSVHSGVGDLASRHREYLIQTIRDRRG